MRITDLLDKRSISLNETPKTKSEALDRIIDLMVASGKINDREAYREQVYAREEESTTGIGEGIAIPHGKCDAVTKPGLAAMVVKDGVEFDALDGQPVTLMFLIAAPNTKDNVHLDVLSKLSVLMMDEVFADAKGKEIAISIPDFSIVSARNLTGVIIRSSNNDGEYIVGCRMPEDHLQIKEYIEHR